MKILTLDIGTGTQDIFLFDSQLDPENCLKMVMPSPTMQVHRRLLEATRRRQAVLLTGVIMGGGPSQWAVEDHLRAGLPVYATPQAARSFNDDLDVVKEMGVILVSEEEANRLPDSITRLELKDFDFPAVTRAFASFGVALDALDAVAIAVFDHGDAPPGISDRKFRFEYLDRRIRMENRLSAFAYRVEDIPPILTRMQAVAASARGLDAPLVVMDTAPAAILGATYDPQVAARQRVLIANIGNFHTLAFRLGPAGIEGVFEHHTGLLDRPKLERLLLSLADGSLKDEEVFGDQGHGALIYNNPVPLSLGGDDFGVAVTGPRRSLVKGSLVFKPYFAVPFGDMMIAGNIGLLSAIADLLPHLRDLVQAWLGGNGGLPPWEKRD